MTNSLSLTKPDAVSRFAALLPRGMDAERFSRLCAMAVHQSPALAKCTPSSLLQAFLACASFGLEPNTPAGHAYVLPYGDRASLVIGYRGFIALIHRRDPDAVVHAAVVHEGDMFSFEYGASAYLRHCPLLDGGGGRKPLAAYAYIRRAASFSFTVMPWSDVLRIRDNSQGYKLALRKGLPTPWTDHIDAMAAKTAIRQLCKTANVGTTVLAAATLDARQEVHPGEFESIPEDAPAVDAPVEQPPVE